MGAHILPDSRLKDQSQGSKIMDWTLPDGRKVTVEVSPVFCANCGIPYGYVPKDNTSWTFWLCRPCFDTYGDIASTYAVSDTDFNEAIANEMEERFGFVLTPEEIAIVEDQGQLGTALEKLLRESPYQ